MLKRSFALLTVAALFAVSLTACGTSSAPEAVQASSQEVSSENQSHPAVWARATLADPGNLRILTVVKRLPPWPREVRVDPVE